MKPMPLKYEIRTFCFFFLLYSMIVGGALGAFYELEIRTRNKAIRERETYVTSLKMGAIKDRFKMIVSDLMILSLHVEPAKLLDAPDDEMTLARQYLAEEFLSHSRFTMRFDQIRFLDESGMEIVRVNYNDGKPGIVPEVGLQSKSQRYYFLDSFRLGPGEVYVSPLDLNIEHGQIEQPLKPMIRFGLPIFDKQGHKRGVVVLNYLAGELLHAFSDATLGSPSQAMLLNPEGYWLRSPVSEDDWGFMDKDHLDRRFGSDFPEAWRKVSKEESGQFQNADGLFTFATVHPLYEGLRSSTGSGEPFVPSEKLLSHMEYEWKVVSFTPQETLIAVARSLRSNFLSVYGLLLLLLVGICWHHTRAKSQRRVAEVALNDSHARLKTLVEDRTRDLTERLKELSGLYAFSVLTSKPGASLEDTLQAGVLLFPAAWQYPEHTCARICVGDMEFRTGNFQETEWQQSEQLESSSEDERRIDVYYLREFPECDEGPFLKEERHLIRGFAKQISLFVDSKYLEADLQASEAKFSSIVENIPGVVYRFGTQATRDVIYISERVFDLTRIPAEHFLDGSFDWASLIVPEDLHRVMSTIVQGYRDNRPYSVEYRICLQNGEQRWVAETGRTSCDEYGRPLWFEGVILDVQERKQVEEEKTKLEDQWRQVQKVEAIGRLAGGVAHDLNNLLSPILGYAELLKVDFALDDVRLESLEQILHAGVRARDLVRQLLAFGRKQTLEYKPVDMNKAIEDFEKLLRHTIRDDIVIKITLSPDIRIILVDIGQIEQVIMNLAINAQDAMPDGGHLIIETAPADLDEDYATKHVGVKPGAYVMLAVTDTGCGMGEETRDQIFEPFFTTKGEMGTGLGLATVYGIVKQHGGNVWVYSEPGKGTVFKVYFPVSEGAVLEEKISKKEITDLRGSETILLVEDSEQVRNLSFAILERQGYTVLVAGNASEALTVLEQHSNPVHLLLTDVVMPEMDGPDLFARVIEKRPGLKVLFMSGYTSNVIARRGVLVEGVSFVQKPFTIKALATKVREVLEQD